MDVWVVAAAAGAGYIAQHWKNILKAKQDFTSKSTFTVSEKQLVKDNYSDIKASPLAEMASTSESEVENVSILGISCNEDSFAQPCTGEIGFLYDPVRKKPTLRTQLSKKQLIKPLTSLESCLMAQLYNENTEIKDYVFNFGEAKTPIKPFIVSNGSKIISKAMEKTPYSESGTVYGVPKLPKIKSRKEQVNGALLFCLGMSVGVLSSFLGNKQEVEKLNEMLKQSENLVQDLQEELEMKELLTVKELAIEEYESQDIHNDDNIFTPKHKLDESTNHDRDEKIEDKSLSTIEAELEAELERLEFSIKTGKLTDFVEPELDFIPDLAIGELRADLFDRKVKTQYYADEDGSGDCTVHSANYAVSPRELSLRLHEIVQSQLEERVKELETALENSQKKSENKFKYFGEDYNVINSWRNISSNESSPVNNNNSSDHPVVINLSGEALDAYNETYDMFGRINDSEEDKSSKSPHEVENALSNEDESDRDETEEMLIKHIVEKAKKSSSIILDAQRVLYSNDEN